MQLCCNYIATILQLYSQILVSGQMQLYCNYMQLMQLYCNKYMQLYATMQLCNMQLMQLHQLYGTYATYATMQLCWYYITTYATICNYIATISYATICNYATYATILQLMQLYTTLLQLMQLLQLYCNYMQLGVEI
jgi:hypothetical protein